MARRLGASLSLAFALFVSAAPGASAEIGTTADRYSLVQGCFALKSAEGDLIAQTGDGYSATGGSIVEAEAFRMQATDLGKYLFFGEAQDFLGLDEGPLAQDDVVVATAPSGRTTWTVDGARGKFTIVNAGDELGLAVGEDGVLVSVPKRQAETFTFVPADDEDCAVYPEIALNATGEPNEGLPRYGEVEGTVDGHMHMMAFEFLGGHAHCGEPWHKFGAPYALKDCEDHEPNGCGAALETGLGGNACHDTGGWPNFDGWPDEHSLTHESSYYRWLERAHLSGLRVFVNLMVENRVLCEVYPDMSAVQGEPKSNCDEMDTVRRQIKRIHQLQDYIDAQEGGPGEGWFRIVQNPFQARKVINRGNLAVIQGMEVSEPFDCGYKGILDNPLPPGNTTPDPRCSKAHISKVLDELWGLGVRQMEITNKFDNQLTGVAGDGGSTGVLVNTGQYGTSGSFWDFDPPPKNPQRGDCGEDGHNHDRVPATSGSPVTQDEIFGNGLAVFLPSLPVLAPVYGPNDKCNPKGLEDGDPGETTFGAHALDGIMDRGFVFDPDHMSVTARDEALDMLEKRDYSGVISSHSWSTENTLPRVYRLGGIITPYAGNSSSFTGAWEQAKSASQRALGDQYFGMGYGADANGFGSQGEPRNPAEE
ncbi:MAG: peptidase, partial [Actinomycetota bacterium]|nr:peptidase [Actinomycetota bacterium]